MLALVSGADHQAALEAADAVGAAAVGDPSAQPALGPLAGYLPSGSPMPSRASDIG